MFYLGFLFCLFPSFVSDNNSSNDDDDNVCVSCVSVDTSEPRKCTGDREITHIYRSSSSLADGTCRRGYAINIFFVCLFFFFLHFIISLVFVLVWIFLRCYRVRFIGIYCSVVYVCVCVSVCTSPFVCRAEKEKEKEKQANYLPNMWYILVHWMAFDVFYL